LYSYLHGASKPVAGVLNRQKAPEPLNFEEISLDDLCRFFKNPFKAYYNKVLGIYYNEEEVLLQDTELFNVNSLQEWSIKQQLLPLDEEQRKQLNRQLVRKGSLPLGNMAEITILQTEKAVEPVRQVFLDITRGAVPQTFQVSVEPGNNLLKGTLENVYGSSLVQVCWSKKETKYLVDAYIKYLVGIAAGSTGSLYFISANKGTSFKAMPVNKNEALKRLYELVEIYKGGFKNIVPFIPDLELKPEDVEAYDMHKFSGTIKNKLEGENATINDAYILNEYSKGYFKQEGVHELFTAVFRKIITPLGEMFPEYYPKNKKKK
jgi:exodeoxyribonuclease V gamma subunit